ncbi:hypothetical protein AgCh_016769 [Apium graveolens]
MLVLGVAGSLLELNLEYVFVFALNKWYPEPRFEVRDELGWRNVRGLIGIVEYIDGFADKVTCGVAVDLHRGSVRLESRWKMNGIIAIVSMEAFVVDARDFVDEYVVRMKNGSLELLEVTIRALVILKSWKNEIKGFLFEGRIESRICVGVSSKQVVSRAEVREINLEYVCVFPPNKWYQEPRFEVHDELGWRNVRGLIGMVEYIDGFADKVTCGMAVELYRGLVRLESRWKMNGIIAIVSMEAFVVDARDFVDEYAVRMKNGSLELLEDEERYFGVIGGHYTGLSDSQKLEERDELILVRGEVSANGR